MEAVVGFAWQVLKQIVFSFVFFWPGWLVVKIITLGRYPRSIHLAKADWLDYELLSFVGVVAVVGAVVLAAYLWR
jgi:hypothetical protein